MQEHSFDVPPLETSLLSNSAASNESLPTVEESAIPMASAAILANPV